MTSHRSRRGMALVVVMVTVILVALAAYGFNHQMTEAYRASRVQTERAQARLAAVSGVDAMRSLAAMPTAERERLIESGSAMFRRSIGGAGESGTGVATEDETSGGWSFVVISPRVDSDSGFDSLSTLPWRVGWLSESAKLNVETLRFQETRFPGHARQALLNLPDATPERVDRFLRSYGIVSRSSGDGGRAGGSMAADRFGASGAASRGLSDADADADRAEGLNWLWTGGDWDHNYRLGPLEQAMLARSRGGIGSGEGIGSGGGSSAWNGSVGSGSSAGETPRGWRNFITERSGRRNVNRSGQPRIFLNGSDLAGLHRRLSAIWPREWADFVILARQYGVSQGGGQSEASGEGAGTALSEPVDDPLSVGSGGKAAIDLTRPPRYRIESPLELVGARVRPERDEADTDGADTGGANRDGADTDGAGTEWRESPFQDAGGGNGDYLERLADDVTTDANVLLEGQIDINVAPRAVLLGIPDMTAELADRIVAARRSPPPAASTRDTVAWLAREGVVEVTTLRDWLPWITVGGECWSAQVIGYRDAISPSFRCTVVIDGRGETPVIRDFRQWDHWGRGFDVSQFVSAGSSRSPAGGTDAL